MKEVIMPVLGMNQETGTLVEWFVAQGEPTIKGEPLMLVATDKTEVEIEATTSGILTNVIAWPGDEVAAGSTIAMIAEDGEDTSLLELTAAHTTSAENSTIPLPEPTPTNSPAATPVAARIAAEHNLNLSQISVAGSRIQKQDVLDYIVEQNRPETPQHGRLLASPKARRIAKENRIDLAHIAGSGPDGAIITADVLNPTISAEETISSPPARPFALQEQTSTIEVSRAWKVMAQRLQESWQTVPHFYLEQNVDARAIMRWQKQIQKRVKEKVTITDLLTKIVAVALENHPRLNASWINEQIIANPEINVGLAVAVQDGLLVPVIHRANSTGIVAIAKRRQELVAKALEGELSLSDMEQGTFTISNLGMYGITQFNAIVNPPQAAILAVGAIEERVIAVKSKPKTRPIMTLTLSCDHRVVDGARGAQFMQALTEMLTDPLSILD